MSMHVFSLLQTKLGYMFCTCFELFILVELQQTMGYHLLCLFSLVMLFCAVVGCLDQSLLFGHIKSYSLKKSHIIRFIGHKNDPSINQS